MFSKAFLFLILVFCVECHSAKETGASAQEGKEVNKNSVEGVAPGKCRIIATLVKIDSTLNNSDPSSPCAKASCKATVKINSILAYGSSFPTEVSEGAEIILFFPNTISPRLACINLSLPDLKKGDRIQALIESRMQPGTEPLYIINDYHKK